MKLRVCFYPKTNLYYCQYKWLGLIWCNFKVYYKYGTGPLCFALQQEAIYWLNRKKVELQRNKFENTKQIVYSIES